MNTTTCTWLNAMTLKVAGLDKRSVRSSDWGQALQTMHLRVVCFAYHRDEYNHLAQAGLSSRASMEKDTAFIVAPIGQPSGAKLGINAALAAAQVIAAAQSLHAACDCLFRVACWALDLDQNIPLDEKIVLSEASKYLSGNSKTELDRLRTSPQFQFLDGFVQSSRLQNLITAKHRQIGKSRKRVELLIRDFECPNARETRAFSALWTNDFLYRDCEVIIEHCNAFGKAIADEMI